MTNPVTREAGKQRCPTCGGESDFQVVKDASTPAGYAACPDPFHEVTVKMTRREAEMMERELAKFVDHAHGQRRAKDPESLLYRLRDALGKEQP